MRNVGKKLSGLDPGVTLRAIILGLLLLPVNTYFIMANGIAYGRSFPTTVSIIFNVVITLTVLIVINGILKRLWPRFALRQGELLTVHIMLCLSSAIAGFDIMQTLVVMIPGGHWFATPENEWREFFWRYLPKWLTISDLTSLQDWYKGESTFYTKEHILLWLRPILWWTVSLTAIIWVMLCLDVLIRRQWIEHEKLSYPSRGKCSGAFLLIFSYQAGTAVWLGVLYFLLYYLLAISLSRIRAEVGPPTHELAMATPRRFLVQVFGSRRLSAPSLTMYALVFHTDQLAYQEDYIAVWRHPFLSQSVSILPGPPPGRISCGWGLGNHRSDLRRRGLFLLPVTDFLTC